MLRIKQQQYMQGFNQVNSIYNSTFNKPVLGEEVNMLKQQYMTDITKQLKDFSSLDLSLPQNIETAEKAFEPMINDQVLNANRSLTANAQSQLGVAESYELSDDPKKRSQYHPAAKQDIYDMMEEITEAGLDPKNYQKIANRKFTPFFDIKQDIIDRFKSEKGMDLVYDEVQGNYIVKTANGERSLQNYEIMASDVLNDPKYNAQLSIQARVEMNRKIRQTRAAMPNATRQQAREAVIQGMGNEASEYYGNLAEGLKTQASTLRQNLTAMGPIETDPSKPGYDPRRLEIAQNYGSQIAGLENKRVSIVGRKADLIKSMSVNPEGYLAEKIRDGYTQSFARSRAANVSREIKTNEVPFKEDESKRGWAAINLNIQKEVNDVNNPNGKKNGSGTQYNSDGTIKMTAQQVKEEAVAPTMMGYALNTDSSKRTAFGVWNNYMGKLQEKANSSLLDVNGGMVAALGTLSDEITPVDIMNFSSALGKDMANSDYKYNKEEAASSNKITAAIKKKYGISVTGPGSMTNALFTITQDYGNRVASGEVKDEDGLLLKLEAATDTYTRNKKEHTALNDEYEKLVLKNVASRKEFENVVYDDNGTKRLITPEKLAGEFANLRYVNPETNQVQKITKDMAISMAAGYLNGTQPVFNHTESNWGTTNTYPVMMVNGQQVRVYVPKNESNSYVSGQNGENVMEMALNPFIEKFTKKYGKPGELKTAYERALATVVPNQTYYQAKTGQMTPVESIPFSTALQGEDAVNIVKELSLGNNIASASVRDANGNVIELTAEQRLSVMNLMKSTEPEIEKAFGNLQYKPFTTGKGTVDLTLSPSLNDDYVKNNKLGDLVGKTISFNVSADAQGETLKKIATNEKFFTYGDVFKGKTVESNSALKALGYSYTVVPNYNDERANSVTIYYNYYLPNKENPAKPILKKVASNPIAIKGDGAVDIDQVISEARMNLVNQFKAVQATIPRVSPASNSAVDPTTFIR